MERTVLLSMLRTLLVGRDGRGVRVRDEPRRRVEHAPVVPRDGSRMLAASASMGVSAIGSYLINHHSSRARPTTSCARVRVGPGGARDGAREATRHADPRLRPSPPPSPVCSWKTWASCSSSSEAPRASSSYVSSRARCCSRAAPRRRPPRGPPAVQARRRFGRFDESAETLSEDAIGPLVGASPSRPSRRAGRHWTEGGGSIGGYDELGAASAAADGAARGAAPRGGGGGGGGGGRRPLLLRAAGEKRLRGEEGGRRARRGARAPGRRHRRLERLRALLPRARRRRRRRAVKDDFFIFIGPAGELRAGGARREGAPRRVRLIIFSYDIPFEGTRRYVARCDRRSTRALASRRGEPPRLPRRPGRRAVPRRTARRLASLHFFVALIFSGANASLESSLPRPSWYRSP